MHWEKEREKAKDMARVKEEGKDRAGLVDSLAIRPGNARREKEKEVKKAKDQGKDRCSAAVGTAAAIILPQSAQKAKAKQVKAQARENRHMRWRSKTNSGEGTIRCQRKERT